MAYRGITLSDARALTDGRDGAVTFEEAFARLEQIVRRLEGGEVKLDESLRLFEEGVQAFPAVRGASWTQRKERWSVCSSGLTVRRKRCLLRDFPGRLRRMPQTSFSRSLSQKGPGRVEGALELFLPPAGAHPA